MAIVFIFMGFAAFKAMILLDSQQCIEFETDDSSLECIEVPDFNIDPFPEWTFVWNPQFVSAANASQAGGLFSNCNILLTPICFVANLLMDPSDSTPNAIDKVTAVVANIGSTFYEIGELSLAFIVWLSEVVPWIFELTLLIFKFTSFLLSVTFTTIPGSPWWVSMIFILPLIFGAIYFIVGVIRGFGGS